MTSSAPKEPKKTPHPGGRPSGYKPEMAKQAGKLCEFGATEADLADFFSVSTVTIWRWANSHKEFCNALRIGKGKADDRVERAMYHKAVGYTHDAVKIFMPAGAKEPVYASYKEHVPPDTVAGKFWLTNRRKDVWRDKTDHEHAGKDGGPLVVQVVRFTDA